MDLLFIQGGTDPSPFFLNLEEYLGPPPRVGGGGGGAGGGAGYRPLKDVTANKWARRAEREEKLSNRIDAAFEELEPKPAKKDAVIKESLTTPTVKESFIVGTIPKIETVDNSKQILANESEIARLQKPIKEQETAKLNEDDFMLLLIALASDPFV